MGFGIIRTTAYCPALFSLSYEYTKSWFAVGLWHSKHAVRLTFSFGFFSAVNARYSHSPLRSVSGYSLPQLAFRFVERQIHHARRVVVRKCDFVSART